MSELAAQSRAWEPFVGETSGARIAVLGWARLAAQGREGSGLNLCVSELCSELASRGHRVMYLRSGMDYSLRPGMRIILKDVWRGVACFDLFNSPNLAPGNFNFNNPAEQAASPAHTALVIDWLRAVRADLVHVQSFEGFGFDLVAAVRKAGFPVAVTPHNYYGLCPQVDLLARERGVCESSDGGRACVGCIARAPDPASYRWWRRRFQTAERWFGPNTLGLAKDRLLIAKDTLRARFASGPGPYVYPDAEPSSAPLEVLSVAAPDVNERATARRALTVLNDYGRRQGAGIAALNDASVILCPSRFLQRVHEAHGVAADLMRHVPLGQPHFDLLYQQAAASAGYASTPWRHEDARPLRLAYFGNCYPNKGLATLVEAVLAMPTSLAARVHVSIRASGDDRPFRARLAGCTHASMLGRYTISDLPALMRTFDVCIFPNMGLENSPLVVLEALHAGKFVIASNLGGPTDWIEPPRNGLLFRPGDGAEMIARVEDLVCGRVAIPAPADIHRASRLRTFAQYVDDVEWIHESLLSNPPARNTT